MTKTQKVFGEPAPGAKPSKKVRRTQSRIEKAQSEEYYEQRRSEVYHEKGEFRPSDSLSKTKSSIASRRDELREAKMERRRRAEKHARHVAVGKQHDLKKFAEGNT